MKTLGRLAGFLVVLGFCLPSYGEILVYKYVQNGTFYFEQDNGEWELETGAWRGYLVIDIDYAAGTIMQAEIIGYGTNADAKWFGQDSEHLELVRIENGTKVQWVVMERRVESDGQTTTVGGFYMLIGSTRNRSIGTEENQEVANRLTGYSLEDSSDEGGHYIEKSTLSATLYPTWTYWANGDGEDEGGQNLDAAVQMIRDYLIAKGYEERP
jgi:hypothetical protein